MIETKNGNVHFRITLKGFLCFQFGTVTLLVLLGIMHYAYAGLVGVDMFMKISKIFDVDRENSIPTVFSVFNLLCSSVLLFVLYVHGKGRAERTAIYWLILSVIFVGLSFDEGAGFHERLSNFGLFTDFLEGRWVAYGVVFSLAVFLFFIPFLWQIDRRTAILLMLSGAIYLTGALVFEYFGGFHAHFKQDFASQTLKILEEGFEMYGIAIFNSTLFSRIVARNISVTVGSKPQASATE